MQVKTFLHSILEATRASGATFVPFDKSTLNELLNIEHGTALPAGVIPEISYLCFGRGGEINATAPGGESISNTQKHKINSCRLNDMIPIVARKVANDLTPDEKKDYVLRRLENHGGEFYFVYYGLVIDITAGTPVVERLTVSGNVTTPAPYVALSSQLEVDPVQLVNGQPTTATSEMLSVYIPFTIQLDSALIASIVDAVTITRGSASLANINEIALVSGIPQTITNNLGGVTATYKELLAAQIMNHIDANIAAYRNTTGAVLKLRLSDTQPLLP